MVLAAHYDSKNITDRNGKEFIGATDSAVPCAILLDIARQLNCLFEKAQGEKVPKLMLILISMRIKFSNFKMMKFPYVYGNAMNIGLNFITASFYAFFILSIIKQIVLIAFYGHCRLVTLPHRYFSWMGRRHTTHGQPQIPSTEHDILPKNGSKRINYKIS